MCVRLHSENSEPTIDVVFSNDARRTPPDATALSMARSHHVTHPSQVSARSCLFVRTLMAVCALPEYRIGRNSNNIRTFCDHINVLHIFNQICIVSKSGWSSTNTTTRMPASSLVFPCPRLTPRRHRQADGQFSPLYPPSPSFSSFGAACMKLCCLPPPSLVRNIFLCCLI